jgi:hypothetical protein
VAVAGQRGRRPRRWQRYQIASAAIGGATGVTLFVIQAVSKPLFGVPLDFGVLPWTLVAIGAWVLYGIRLSLNGAAFGNDSGSDDGGDDGGKDAEGGER